jgi:hypothetical protein
MIGNWPNQYPITKMTMAEHEDNIFRESEVDEKLASTSSPTVAEKRDGFRSCDVENAGAREAATMGFVYEVEIGAEYISLEAEKVLLDALSNEIVASVHDWHCRRHLLRQSGRQLIIESIASGSFLEERQSCEPVHGGSLACHRYEGTVIVGYTEDGNDSTQVDVGTTVLGQISSDMENDSYVGAVNSELESFGPKVTTFRYGGSDYFDNLDNLIADEIGGVQSGNFVSDEDALSTLGKAMLPVLGVLFVAMIFAFFLMWRGRAQGGQGKREIATLVSDGADDLNRSNDPDECFASTINTSHLGNVHNSDVQRCTKPNCSACNRLWLHKIEEEHSQGGGEEEETDYGQSVETRVLPPSNRSAIFRGIFQRKDKLPPVEVVPTSFKDEPPAVKFVKVDEPGLTFISYDTRESVPDGQVSCSDYHGESSHTRGYYSSDSPGESSFSHGSFSTSQIASVDMAGIVRDDDMTGIVRDEIEI